MQFLDLNTGKYIANVVDGKVQLKDDLHSVNMDVDRCCRTTASALLAPAQSYSKIGPHLRPSNSGLLPAFMKNCPLRS